MDVLQTGVLGLGGIAQLASIASAFWLGGLLLRRSTRGEGGMPERLLGAHLLLAIAVGSLLLSAASTSSVADEPLSEGVLTALVVVGNVAVIVGLMAILWFNAIVFHAGEAAGRGIATALSASLWLGFGWYLFAGLDPNDLYGPASWPFVVAMAAGDVWIVIDGLRFRRQLKKRLELGLAEPILVERLLLWSLASLARFCLVLIAPVTTSLVGVSDLRIALMTPLLTFSAVLILLATVSIWLMLVPAGWYRRWVARRYAHGS